MRHDDELLLAQILRDGIGAVEDLGERVKVARDVIGALRRLGLTTAARSVEDEIDEDECLERGICHLCGGELSRRDAPEYHPYGATVAVERRQVVYCPECGWEAE